MVAHNLAFDLEDSGTSTLGIFLILSNKQTRKITLLLSLWLKIN